MEIERDPGSVMVRRRPWVGRILLISVLLLAVLVVAYLGAGYMVYSQLADVRGSCDKHLTNLPQRFGNTVDWPDKDYSAYFMPDYETVRFASRQLGLQIAGWYMETDPAAPAVIVLDGLGGCKHALAALLPAGMLYHSGFNVLVIDLRDTGDSDAEDGFSAVGNEEYLDVLGAWDWLTTEKGFAAQRVGILGNSLGAASVLVAARYEPRMAAIALNSPFANLPQIIREELRRVGYPAQLAPAAVLMARLIKGENLVEFDPVDSLNQLGDRPLFVVHSADDHRIGIHHSYLLRDAAQAANVDATFWFIEGANHVQGPGIYPQEFQSRIVAFFGQHLGE